MAKKTASPHESSSEGNQIAITVTEKGPYLVTGNPPLAMQFIMPDSEGESWYFQEGRHFSTEKEPTALCRCGLSRSKPYCDGSHLKEEWDSAITSGEDRIMDEVEITEGQRVTLNDNEKYCVFARFCHPYGGVWDLTAASGDSQSRKLAVREASMCPSARLTAWDNRTGKPYEFIFEPSLGLIEDPAIGASGGLWVRGGIRIQREDSAAADTPATSPIATVRMPPSNGKTGWREPPTEKRSPEALPVQKSKPTDRPAVPFE